MIRTSVLGEAVGIQWSGLTDNSETNSQTGLGYPLIIGKFKRGRTDQPMTITSGNIKALLGYDPTNKDYIAVQAYLDTKVPSVQVLRIGEVSEETGGTGEVSFAASSISVNFPPHSEYALSSTAYELMFLIHENNQIVETKASYTTGSNETTTTFNAIFNSMLLSLGLAYSETSNGWLTTYGVIAFAQEASQNYGGSIFGMTKSLAVSSREIGVAFKASNGAAVDLFQYIDTDKIVYSFGYGNIASSII